MFKFFKNREQAPTKEEKSEETEIKLTSKDRERLALLGIKFIEKNPYFAAVCLSEAGYPKEIVRPLFELDKFLEGQTEEGRTRLTREEKARKEEFRRKAEEIWMKVKEELGNRKAKSVLEDEEELKEDVKRLYIEMLERYKKKGDEDKIRLYEQALKALEQSKEK